MADGQDHSPDLDQAAALLDALSSQLVVVDAEGGIRTATRAGRERTEGRDYLPAFHLVAQPDLDLLARVRRGVEAVLAGTQAEFVVEYQIPNRGEPTWMLLRAAPLKSGTSRHALIAHVDITA